MGYFNYFIKCIIRNISYKLCKPKVFLTVLLSVCILFCLKHYGFCALSDGDYEMITDGFATITNNQGVMISQLSSMGVNVTDIENELIEINNMLSGISSTSENISSKLTSIYNKIETLNTNILNIYNTLETNQQELINTLETNNAEIQFQLNDLKNLLIGGETETQNVKLSSFSFGNITPSLGGSGNYTITSSPINVGFTTFKYTFEKGYTYDFVRTSGGKGAYSRIMGTMDSVVVGGSSFNLTFLYDGAVDNASFSFTPKKSGTMTIVVNNPTGISGTIWTITKKASGSLSNINNTISQGNQLQQEQNQLQQDQNNFLKQETSDTDVSIDNFNSVDANDITSSGLSGIFTSIYNSINSWSSKDIVLPVPFTNKSFTIPANYTHNMLSSVGGGLLITIISTVYYFIVARFIIYSVTGIINSIKSGSILETDTKTNITTEML